MLLHLVCIGQENPFLALKETDSLKNLLPTASQHEQADILNKIAEIYAPVDFDSSIYYSAKSMRSATIQGYSYGIGCSRLYTGNAYYYHQDFRNALVSYLSAQTILEEGAHYDELGELSMMLGYINFFIMRTDIAVSYYHKARDYFEAAGNDFAEADVLYALNMTYWRDGPLDSAIIAGERFLNYARKYHKRTYEASALLNLGMTITDKNALKYDDQALEIARELNNEHMEVIIYNNIASIYDGSPPLYGIQINLSLARDYYNAGLETARKVKYYSLMAMIYQSLGHIDYLEGRYEQAKNNLDSCEKYLDSAALSQNLFSPVGFIAFGKIFESFITLRTKNHLYATCFDLAKKTAKYDDAIKYQQLYFESLDTLRSVQQGRQLELIMAEAEAERTDQKIRALAQENELKQLKIEQSRFISAGIGAVVVIISLFLLLFFQRKRLIAEQKSISMEQRLLRAQMNPHFLFNSLASIQNYIINEDTDRASTYLSRFSQLVRNILDNSVEEYVPLEKEIETIRYYLDLQKVRYAGKFDFNIDIDTDIDTETVRVPPMLAQPFIENAIEHGIKHRETPGHIDIRFHLEGSLIRFEVEDDGVGREKAREIEAAKGTRHRSMATSITIDRLATINKKLKKKIRMEIEDLKDESGAGIGTRVRFGIPILSVEG
jgi:signal transduction histidine kinase